MKGSPLCLLYHVRLQNVFYIRKKIAPLYKNTLQLLSELEAIQLDPVSIVDKNHHLTASLRIPHYKPSQLELLLKEGHAFEYIAQAACLLPLTDYPLFADIRHHFSLRYKEELHRYKESTSTILSRLENEGPLASAAFTSLKKSERRLGHRFTNDKRNESCTAASFFIQVTFRL